jgi:adenylate cyclase
MESSGLPGAIQVSASTYEVWKADFVLAGRGPVEVKGSGQVRGYFLKARKLVVWNLGAGEAGGPVR